MNCDVDFFLPQDGLYGALINNTFTGYFAEIISRRADMITGAVVLTYYRSLVTIIAPYINIYPSSIHQSGTELRTILKFVENV